jgi:hypothetical protein
MACKYAGSIPDTYHETLAPLIFGAYADDQVIPAWTV